MFGIATAVLLISAAVGYKTLLRAAELNADAKLLKNFGMILGTIIVALSLVSVGCITYKVHCGKYAGKACPLSYGKKISQPQVQQ